MEDMIYKIWLDGIKGLSRNDKIKLVEYAGSAADIYEMEQEELEKIGWLKKEKTQSILNSRNNCEPERLLEDLCKKQINFISFFDNDFPLKLINIYDPPFGLYYRGKLPDPGLPSVSIVGARMCDSYGRTWALKIGRTLAEAGCQVISGMAYGIDAASHWGAIKGEGRTFAVLGCGVDIVYPAENRKLYDSILETDGGIISEYIPGTEPKSYLFPLRNRIISGLSDAVVLIQAKKKSGSLITADLAMEQGKDVYALPGHMDDALSQGCNQLIRQGAGIVTSTEDLLLDLKLEGLISNKKTVEKKIFLEKEELLVYSDLDFTPKLLEDIYNHVNLPRLEVLKALKELENKKMVEECFMNYYIKTC